VTARHIIGRIYVVRPALTEKYALRLLLSNVKDACSYEYIRTVAGQQHPSFHAAAVACGLLEDGYEGEVFLREVAQERACAPQQLCRETAGVLVHGDGRFDVIWEELAPQLAIDPPLGVDIHSTDWRRGMDAALERAVVEILANVRRLAAARTSIVSFSASAPPWGTA